MLFSFLTRQDKKLLTFQILPALVKRPFKQPLDTKWGGCLLSTAQIVMLTEHNLQHNRLVHSSCCQKAEPGIAAETKSYIFSTARAPHFRFEARWLEQLGCSFCSHHSSYKDREQQQLLIYPVSSSSLESTYRNPLFMALWFGEEQGCCTC